MLGSIFIGLSGMNAYSRGLRQISNNITNLNSTGFKTSTLNFVNLFGAGSGGQGVALSDARIDFSQGELRQTDRDLDLAIDGDGFLVLLNEGEHVFARTGSFEVTDDGYIVLAGTDYKLTALNGAGQPTALNIAGHRTHAPQATTTIKFADNLSSGSSGFTLSDLKVFDSTGASDKWQVKLERAQDAVPGEWTVVVTNGAGAEVGRQTLRFLGGIADPAASKLTFSDEASSRSVVLDFSTNVTSFSSGEVSTLRVAEIDGFGAGEVTAISINEDGELEIAYSNEQKQSLGALTVAQIRDPQSLEQQAGGTFSYEGGLGVSFVTGAREGIGRVVPKRLEASNVDLSREFGDLILVQRGYQASSQVVSVSNDMIQQLFGIRGQG